MHASLWAQCRARFRLFAARVIAAVFILSVFSGLTVRAAEPALEKDALEAYIFGYPLVLMAETRESMTSAPAMPDRPAFDMNRFTHVDRLPGPDDDHVIRPNVDTLYSVAWLDLSQGPIVLNWPDMGERYWVFQVMDGWTDVVGSPGTRTVGQTAGSAILVRDGYAEELPSAGHVIEIDTDIAWIIGRIATAPSAEDITRTNALQQQFTLSAPEVPVTKGEPEAVRPHDRIAAMAPEVYFSRLGGLLENNPPRAADEEAVAKLVRVSEALDGDDAAREAIAKGVTKARGFVDNEVRGRENLGPNGWRGGQRRLGDYGTEYAFRSRVARIGLGANLTDDAVYMSTEYDVDSEFLEGSAVYRIHFGPDDLPPVEGFWSITLYGMDGFLPASVGGKHAIGDRDNLVRDEEGGITIQLSPAPPVDGNINWLPTPEGEQFNLTARLYYPQEDILSGDWQMPPVTRVDQE